METAANKEIDLLDWESSRPQSMPFMKHMIAGNYLTLGSIAGISEHVSMYPVDTIKTHMQASKQ